MNIAKQFVFMFFLFPIAIKASSYFNSQGNDWFESLNSASIVTERDFHGAWRGARPNLVGASRSGDGVNVGYSLFSALDDKIRNGNEARSPRKNNRSIDGR